jgi:drug/metabolite transporter (DMT)-like permease
MIAGLVLVSAFLHAGWNALLRVEPERDGALTAAIWVAALIALAVALIRLALGATWFATPGALGWSAVAGVCEAVYFATLAIALSRGPLGPVYTISRGGAVVLVWPLALAWFGEPVSVAAIAGSAIVVAGLALAAAPNRATPAAARAAILPGMRRWALACAVAIAGYHLAYKAALAGGGNPSAVFAVALAVASAINLARSTTASRATVRAVMRTRALRVLAIGAVMSGSFLILVEALAAGGAGAVLTLRNTSVLFATMFAAALGDRPRAVHVAGAIAVAVGAAIIALA